ncbi:MAG: aspartate/glutamate racemase family protein [Gammaproteobacteria bacterium]|jgi:aspartate racemase|nr:aspartate/glutamate racemase family protein [Gammaproteobacteria bacterium]MBT3860796.1 aspartate/glutamate racemase family protein [Gammaproteobacteria bacterium]MBT3986949.1 aspartate/glutamate racemase family protein [Gammaproteobacteria bacterium]MBT4255047.1 aspartate/glutamate racemase family protein [Gammaproteobacteria bacterium]MBT4582070.1 aspartate/glutamate racemase family protein [Gammaproteobacteria bacterium]
MKTIGLIGGMSWESTSTYYNLINEGIKQNLGGLHSAKIAMYSVDFDEIEKLQRQGGWQETASLLGDAAKSVEAAGADFLLICTNTMHKVADEIGSSVSIPLLHIADATAQQLSKDEMKRVGLLGTRFTMEQDFYKKRLHENHGIEVLTPEEADRQVMHDIIYKELCLGIINDESRELVLKIIDSLRKQGAECIILGCTEIPLLVKQKHTEVPLYDTTAIHAGAAVNYALLND